MTGHIRQRGAGWELRYDVGADPLTGKRRTHTETVRGTKRDAQRRLREIPHGLDHGQHVDPGKLTTGQWLGHWLEECRHRVAPKTWQERAGYVRRYLVPAVGAMPLAKLAPAHVQALYTSLLTSGRADGRGGLAPQTVRHVDRILHVALERARRLRLIATNPVDDATPPRVERAPIVTLRPEQQAGLLEALHGAELYTPVLVALGTGLRRGELLGLAGRTSTSRPACCTWFR
jgi:integrase